MVRNEAISMLLMSSLFFRVDPLGRPVDKNKQSTGIRVSILLYSTASYSIMFFF